MPSPLAPTAAFPYHARLDSKGKDLSAQRGSTPSTMTISATTKKQVVADNRRHDTDSGSPEVQIAILTERINALTDHFKQHRKDHAGRRGLLLLVGKRNRLLKYLAATRREDYTTLIHKLGLRK